MLRVKSLNPLIPRILTKNLAVSFFMLNFAARKYKRKINIMVSEAFKNRTRDEIISAFRESIRRKYEWEEQSRKELAEMRRNQINIAL